MTTKQLYIFRRTLGWFLVGQILPIILIVTCWLNPEAIKYNAAPATPWLLYKLGWFINSCLAGTVGIIALGRWCFKIIPIAIMLSFLYSCEKDIPQKDAQKEDNDTVWHLNLQVPTWSIDYEDVEYSRGDLCNGLHGEVTGEAIRFQSIDELIVVQIMREFDGRIVQIQGSIPDLSGNIHPFSVFDDTLRICNGPQTSNYILNLTR